MSSARALRFGFGVAALIVLFDQVSKWWILAHVMQPPRVIEITSFFNLVLGWNRGISFGMFGGGGLPPWVLAVLALAIVTGLGIWMWRDTRWRVVMALGLVIGGAVGNVIDRLRFGAVADFLDVHAMGYHWPAFNVADVSISVGAAVLVLDSLFARAERPKNGDDDAAPRVPDNGTDRG